MTTVPQVARTLQTLFTTTAATAARDAHFIQRQRKLTAPAFVQGLVFGWLAHPDATYAQLVQAIARAGSRITPQALQLRFTEEAASCLETILRAAATAVIGAEEVGQSLLARFPAVWLLDSSTVRLPAHFATTWSGSGEAGIAAVKLHTLLDLRWGQLQGPLLTPARQDDKRSPFLAAPLAPGALRIIDLGFYALAQLRAIGEAGAYWLCRAQSQTTLITADGRHWSLLALLRAHTQAAVIDLPVTLGSTARVPARLIAFRLDGQAAAARRRRLEKTIKRKRGRAVSTERLALCAWDIAITNGPADLISAEESRVLLRARWQIELLFKRWKSEGTIDESRSQQPLRMLCELYAKLLGQVVLHWCSVVGSWHLLDRSLWQVGRLVRDYVTELARALPAPRRLRAVLRAIRENCAVGCRVNRRKTKPNHCQLLHEAPRAA
jgi:Transposase DDE domain